ncbi:hypothetical protein [Sorangium sp. So ce1078]|uniref:hypothetical protein n=1 Tax=Sorangium sp. So ce1078 TaxID=3133329 RepID=UPI003F60E347
MGTRVRQRQHDVSDAALERGEIEARPNANHPPLGQRDLERLRHDRRGVGHHCTGRKRGASVEDHGRGCEGP